MERGRVGFFMPGLAGGGAERAMLTLAEGMVDRGYGVDLVVCSARGPLLDEVPRSVRLVNMGVQRIIAGLPGLVRYFRRERPVAMLSALAPANCIAVWARCMAGVATRLVLVEQNTASVASVSAAALRERFMPTLMRYAYPRADGIVAVSDGVADDLAHRVGLERHRIEVLYNPVVTPRMQELSRARADHPWFAEEASPVVLGVGRLTKQKDFATLLRAFARVRQHRLACLVILGEGEERKALEQLAAQLGIQDDVTLPGFVSNPYSYMRQASLFVLSSAWEGFGNVVAEAMACGTPVVSTDCPSGPSEILDGGLYGRLVPVGEAPALAEAMLAALNGAVPSGDALRARADHFSAQAVLGAYERVILGQSDD